LVPVKDATALADAIRELVVSTEKRRQFGLAGRRFAEQRFGQQQIGATYMHLYQQLLAGASKHD
jgi:glycosyltransferase involved in cell wall biosynthesis